MDDNQKHYWKGIEQLTNDPAYVKNADKEFPDYLPINENKRNGEDSSSGSTRRDFLKMMGFGIAAASLASCEAPVRYAIPYLNKPVEVDPGIPNFYASTYSNGGDYCSIVVKTREGRPIKIEGNSLSSITKGGVSAQVDASVLSLYDQERLQSPVMNKTATEWAQLDREVISRLNAISGAGGQIRIVSNTILSPATKAVIADFTSRYPTSRHIMYDQLSSYGMRVANERSFGQAIIPSYDFSKANVIVAFGGADFLGTWLSPIEYTKQYSSTRKIGKDKKTMSRHFHFESNLSLTGANADYRTPIKASQEGRAIAALHSLISGGAAGDAANFPNLDKAAKELVANRGNSLVVSGSNDPNVQMLVNAINSQLGNYGTTINLNLPLNYRQGDDNAMGQFVNDVNTGAIQAIIFYNANPVYDHLLGQVLAQGLQKVKLSVATNERMDETASLVQFVAPDHHYLESWNDAEPKRGYYSLAQPAITPIFNTRQAQDSLLLWSNQSEVNYYNYLQNYWRNNIFTGGGNFHSLWDATLFNGVLEPSSAPTGGSPSFGGNVAAAILAVGRTPQAESNEVELVIYQKVGIGNGSMANNPWLQELPDPVTKACWDNYLTIPISMVEQLNYKSNDGQSTMVSVTIGERSFTLPAIVQPGQAPGTVGLAIGYGRTSAGKVANNVGINAYPLFRYVEGIQSNFLHTGVKLEGSSTRYAVAQTQTHETYMGRKFVVQESILSEYQKDPMAGRYQPKIATKKGPMSPEDVSLWGGHKYPNHHWGWTIDMNSCTGCSACVVACQSENNIPVVGRDEVLNRREMHWIRIDRYYSSKSVETFREAEIVAENPDVTFQVMTCQHCNNAPCETVCPVAATTHSTEGLNQMAYNRCIGTRYCANNCPYKVRRFNWFKYHQNESFPNNISMNNDLGRMVLNPDVTVRSRGVMEKCTLCVQRIQYGKLEAKKQGRRPIDGEIVTACASACPADAIVFGDMNDADSRLVQLLSTEVNGRAYHVLEELNTNPNTFYLTKIRNKDKEESNVS
ncbi:MAG: TAT-variant-translocated molybdopterin oxidoreductase [Bacteroidota bacterium]|nr:TAT-variant-translocated molybdopterin oxidoreductase [Bacteroidota bacterium]MDQ3536237.1 TAT-variant-translocated molybdopterin oxidoreductase [Bacteroidota bacterium]